MLTRIYSRMASWALHQPLSSLLLVACSITAYTFAVIVVGIVAGMEAQKKDYPEKIAGRLSRITSSWSNEQTGEWRDRITNLHKLEVARIHIGNGLGRGGGLAEAAGNILFVSSKGRFGYIDNSNQIRPLDLTVPMNLAALRQSPNYEDPLFAYNTIRVTDLLVRETDPGHYELYAAHHYYKPNCMQFKVSSIGIEADVEGIRAKTRDWRDLFVARPHCIRNKDRGRRFAGDLSGGRLVQLDKDSLLLSVGDHHFDGFYDSWQAAMDPQTDLGKIIKIDLRTGQSRIFAKGVRNPQGLTVTRDGRVWEAEHGPKGGDEVNLIRENANYGWPIVTYGTNYGYPSRRWPFNPVDGAHDGYAVPAFAFVPSVGISNIVEPDPAEFPNWRSSLIAGSLREHKLFLLRVEGDRIVYAESIDTERDRVRDIISRQNGELVYLSDKGDLVFIRNADRHRGDRRTLKVSFRGPLSTPFREEEPPTHMTPVARGRYMYLNGCANCHSLDGSIGIGPPLNGIVGRPVGSIPGYGYSRALDGYVGIWTRELLTSFLTDPDRHFPGTKMPLAPISYMEVPDVITFLASKRRWDKMQNTAPRNINIDNKRSSPGPRALSSARGPHRER